MRRLVIKNRGSGELGESNSFMPKTIRAFYINIVKVE